MKKMKIVVDRPVTVLFNTCNTKRDQWGMIKDSKSTATIKVTPLSARVMAKVCEKISNAIDLICAWS